MILGVVLRQVVKRGTLTVTDWRGRTRKFGDGKAPIAHIHITSAAAARRMALDPDLHLGEAYMSGGLVIPKGSIYDFLALACINSAEDTNRMRTIHQGNFVHHALYKWRMLRRGAHQSNVGARSKHNVHVHYDLGEELYDLFLDRHRQYSCAYFEKPDSTLDEAQLAKMRHVAAKLALKPGLKVLDIGSGWGGLAFYMAEMFGVDVTGVTLSEEQHKAATAEATRRGLSKRVRFLLQDYRTLDRTFDRIVSVGMFEHVGINHFQEFFNHCFGLLKPDGVGLVHSINRSDGPGATSAWVAKYIFPGGYAPALSEVTPALERSGLYVTDIEILRLHYARTLALWRKRFMVNRNKALALYDERFCRMWEFYLAGAECGFRFLGMNNFQIQFARDQKQLPFTRDYIEAQENELRKKEAKSRNYRRRLGKQS